MYVCTTYNVQIRSVHAIKYVLYVSTYFMYEKNVLRKTTTWY
jgi:hypothetical protein